MLDFAADQTGALSPTEGLKDHMDFHIGDLEIASLQVLDLV